MTAGRLRLVPTADVYRTIASRLDSARHSVLTLLRSISAAHEVSPFVDDDGRASAGRLERTVVTTLEVASANLAEIAAELGRQIAEARHRAAVCDRYTEAVRVYHRSLDPSSPFPRRPASWADHGW
jgi:hypothetical protein